MVLITKHWFDRDFVIPEAASFGILHGLSPCDVNLLRIKRDRLIRGQCKKGIDRASTLMNHQPAEEIHAASVGFPCLLVHCEGSPFLQSPSSFWKWKGCNSKYVGTIDSDKLYLHHVAEGVGSMWRILELGLLGCVPEAGNFDNSILEGSAAQPFASQRLGPQTLK